MLVWIRSNDTPCLYGLYRCTCILYIIIILIIIHAFCLSFFRAFLVSLALLVLLATLYEGIFRRMVISKYLKRHRDQLSNSSKSYENCGYDGFVIKSDIDKSQQNPVREKGADSIPFVCESLEQTNPGRSSS